jgi:hypothetical protein
MTWIGFSSRSIWIVVSRRMVSGPSVPTHTVGTFPRASGQPLVDWASRYQAPTGTVSKLKGPAWLRTAQRTGRPSGIRSGNSPTKIWSSPSAQGASMSPYTRALDTGANWVGTLVGMRLPKPTCRR